MRLHHIRNATCIIESSEHFILIYPCFTFFSTILLTKEKSFPYPFLTVRIYLGLAIILNTAHIHVFYSRSRIHLFHYKFKRFSSIFFNFLDNCSPWLISSNVNSWMPNLLKNIQIFYQALKAAQNISAFL